ncbi:TRAP transporter substrate-binding protein [Hydrogenophaga sp. BPS33]|uniref:TRAP transporter substrate-binding protein n=1 Tax=Hydrogenophaga sp. BPS33 TaxID=2651974 RepID=UPI00131FE08F|nr:TRAP transporter substrate-binding protein [Hydrogenophaga sp. BPS33]QHE88553.1 TRAP transporter substrate-binding protein [Hydrogenophaga sp. BPS33]
MQTPHSWRCAHDIVADSALNVLLREFLPDMERLSGGQLTVSLHPDGELGGPDDMVDMLARNEIQMHPVSGMILSRLTPVVAIEGFPFAFGTSKEACAAMAGAPGDRVRDALRQLGIHAFRAVLPQGLNHVFSRGRRIERATDLDGLRIRVGNSPYLKDLYRSLGCDPQPVDLQHVTAALADGRAEGVEMTINSVERSPRHRHMDHIAMVGIRFACFWLCVNLDAWQMLDAPTQERLEAHFETLAARYSEDMDRLHEESLSVLESKGYTVTEVHREGLVTRLKESGFIERWRAHAGIAHTEEPS